MPVTGIVGYPAVHQPEETVTQIQGLWAQGWRRFKLPIAPTPDASIARLAAAREAFPDAWLGIDANFYHKTVRRCDRLRQAAGRPGHRLVRGHRAAGRRPDGARDPRRHQATPVAMGDEQGGSYHPQALLSSTRWTTTAWTPTTNGGITRLRGSWTRCVAHGNRFTPAHVPAHPFPGPGRPGLHRRAHRVGHPGHGRPPHGRSARPAGRPGRPDGPAARPAGLRHARGSRLDPRAARGHRQHGLLDDL